MGWLCRWMLLLHVNTWRCWEAALQDWHVPVLTVPTPRQIILSDASLCIVKATLSPLFFFFLYLFFFLFSFSIFFFHCCPVICPPLQIPIETWCWGPDEAANVFSPMISTWAGLCAGERCELIAETSQEQSFGERINLISTFKEKGGLSLYQFMLQHISVVNLFVEGLI